MNQTLKLFSCIATVGIMLVTMIYLPTLRNSLAANCANVKAAPGVCTSGDQEYLSAGPPNCSDYHFNLENCGGGGYSLSVDRPGHFPSGYNYSTTGSTGNYVTGETFTCLEYKTCSAEESETIPGLVLCYPRSTPLASATLYTTEDCPPEG